jgi:ketosteroid isomerase-like protein
LSAGLGKKPIKELPSPARVAFPFMSPEDSRMSEKSEILALEKKFWDAIQAKDPEAASALLGDECIVTGAQGIAKIDRDAFARMTREGKWTLHEYDLRDVEMLDAGPDVAVIGYKVTEKVSVNGEDMTLEAADSSVWCRKDGNWVCVLHTESVLGDPFGRDRKKP